MRTVFDCMRVLVEHGALWRPEGRSTLKSTREALYKCEPAVTVDFVKLLAGSKAAPEEILEQLLDDPAMRRHLSSLGMNLPALPSSRLKRRASASV